MPLQIIRQDITQLPCDAIVNAAKESLLGGGGVDGAIHRAAGPELLKECRTLGGCRTGQSKITRGYRLPCKYVIHTVGPVWQGGSYGEKALLESCYRTALELAAEYGCETVAFPLISSGIFGYPKDQALRVAVDTIAAFLSGHDMTVFLVIFSQSGFRIAKNLFDGVQSYIDDHYVEEHTDRDRERARRAAVMERIQGIRPCRSAPPSAASAPQSVPLAPLMEDAVSAEDIESAEDAENAVSGYAKSTEDAVSAPAGASPVDAAAPVRTAAPVNAAMMGASAPSLEEMLNRLDESFSQMLLRKIDESGMTDAQCYRKANIDRKLFSKIRSDIHYRPSKPTAIAFAIALELPLVEARDLLGKAGYALSHSSRFDIIIEYFIIHGNYNIFEINETLFAFDQSLLGGTGG